MPELSTRELRQIITERLPTDVDLVSFCQDHFPEERRQLTSGMSHQQMVNILLDRLEGRVLADLLLAYKDTRFRRATIHARSPFRGRGVLWASAVGLSLATLSISLGPQLSQDFPISSAQPVLLESEPTGVLVLDRILSRELGRTPLRLHTAASGPPRELCLVMEGYHNQVVRLTESTPLLIKMEAESAPDSTSIFPREKCNVRIPRH